MKKNLQNYRNFLIIKTDSDNFVYKTAIFNDWTKDLFQKYRVVAWKYIETPDWINSEQLVTSDFIPFFLWKSKLYNIK